MVYMVDIEQMINDMGYEKYIESIMSLGVSETTMYRFAEIVKDEHGYEVYMDWLMDNADELGNNFLKEIGSDIIDNEDTLQLSAMLVNEFIKWIDSLN